MLCCAYTEDQFFYIETPQEAVAARPVESSAATSEVAASGGCVYRKPAVRDKATRMENLPRYFGWRMRTRALEANHRRRTCWYKRRRRQAQAW